MRGPSGWVGPGVEVEGGILEGEGGAGVFQRQSTTEVLGGITLLL